MFRLPSELMHLHHHPSCAPPPHAAPPHTQVAPLFSITTAGMPATPNEDESLVDLKVWFGFRIITPANAC